MSVGAFESSLSMRGRGRQYSAVTRYILCYMTNVLGRNETSKHGQNCCQERKQETSTLNDKSFLALIVPFNLQAYEGLACVC